MNTYVLGGRMKRVILGVALAALAGSSSAASREMVAGPLAVGELTVTDGDSFRGRVTLWPGMYVETAVRVRGVDTPEMRGKCPGEIAAAASAADFTRAFLSAGPITIRDISNDKYAGRVDAAVSDGAGRDLAEALIAAGLARRYNGRGPRAGWC